MISHLISKAFLAASGAINSPPKLYNPRKLYYVAFEIHEPEIVQKIADWQKDRQESLKTVHDYLDSIFSSDFAQVFYRLDKDGFIKDVAYNGSIPEGWSSGDEQENRTHHWVEPRDPLEIKKIMRLPAIPGYRKMAEILDWPYFDAGDAEHDEHGLFESVNRSIRPGVVNERALIHLPHPNNFSRHPEIAERLRAWQPPAFIKLSHDCGPKRLHIKP